MDSISFRADSIRVSGPRQSDQSYTITFTTGEYQKEDIAGLLLLPSDKVLKVTVEVE